MTTGALSTGATVRRRRPRSRSSGGAKTTLGMLATAWAALGAAQASGSVVQQKLYGLPTGLAYYVEVIVGSPLYTSQSSTQFNLLIDTGSSNTAVVTADCCSATSTSLYSCAASSTCADQGQQISVSYVTGSWSGALVRDTLSSSEIGVVTDVPFTEIQQQSNFIQSGYDGIIGLAYPSIASPTTNPPAPYFETIQAAKSLPNVFSTLLCGSLQSLLIKDVSYTDSLYSGELLLGGTTGANGEVYYKDELVYTPLVQERWYNVLTTAIKVGDDLIDVGCKDINSPRTIIDSGTSNMAFPSAVYAKIVESLRTKVQKIVPGLGDSFFSDSVPCCGSVCDPTNPNATIFDMPSLTISVALDDHSDQQISITIPPEYIWRPLMLYTNFGVQRCRVFGISEGEQTLLGDVFMDGLFTAHDRENQRLGLGVAKSCPNGVTSTKTITVEKLQGSADSICDCVSSTDRKKSLLSSYLPFSSKPCFFWIWWMYLVVGSAALIVISLCVIVYVFFQRRRFRREARLRLSRQQSNQLGRNLLTPQCDPGTPPLPRGTGRPTATTTTTTNSATVGGAYVAPESRPSATLTASTSSRPSEVQIDVRRVHDHA